MNRTTIAEALETLRPSLDADGFELELVSTADDGSIGVVLRARPDACLDCLVPEETMVKIIERAVQERDPEVRRVDLTKEGFDGLTGH